MHKNVVAKTGDLLLFAENNDLALLLFNMLTVCLWSNRNKFENEIHREQVLKLHTHVQYVIIHPNTFIPK